MRVKYLATICLSLSSLQIATAQINPKRNLISHEQELVQATYDKFSYAAKLGVLADYALSAPTVSSTGL